MITSRVIAMAALFSVTGALAGCATNLAGSDRPQWEYYSVEDTRDGKYHRFHNHFLFKQIDRNIAGFGSH